MSTSVFVFSSVYTCIRENSFGQISSCAVGLHIDLGLKPTPVCLMTCLTFLYSSRSWTALNNTGHSHVPDVCTLTVYSIHAGAAYVCDVLWNPSFRRKACTMLLIDLSLKHTSLHRSLSWLVSALVCVCMSVRSGGHGRLPPADLAHRRDQPLLLPVALPQRESLDVLQDQSRLSEAQLQAADRVELQVINANGY